ncbi:MOSC domain-containing protein [Phlyctema vagabunda]|uniref:MOSC domain-containing protein n=1 Tax=Phlyctema vagabunda TaxID=108571 RepID=A0ABR4P2T6_9HELO
MTSTGSRASEKIEEVATMKVTQLYVYPIKSLRPISLGTSELNAQGLIYDRRFMLLKLQEDGTLKNMHVSQYYEMVLFHCKIRNGSIIVEYRIPNPPVAPDAPSQHTTLEIPAQPDCRALRRVRIKMHGSPASSAYRMEDEYNQWFSECFGFEVVLAYIGDGNRPTLGTINPNSPDKSSFGGKVQQAISSDSTTVKSIIYSSIAVTGLLGAYAVWAISSTQLHLQGPQAITNGLVAMLVILYGLWGLIQQTVRPAYIAFSDCAPLLIASESSLTDVHPRVTDGPEISMEKFRPNIVVDGEGKWDEDFWGELKFGDAKLPIRLTANCARCVSLNVDLETGKAASGDAGQVLKKLMKDRRVDAGSRFSPIFGRYAFPMRGGTISVGDDVIISKRNTERTTWDWPSLTS